MSKFNEYPEWSQRVKEIETRIQFFNDTLLNATNLFKLKFYIRWSDMVNTDSFGVSLLAYFNFSYEKKNQFFENYFMI